MNFDEIQIITRYIGSWFWHLIAIMFLCTLIVIIVLQNYVFIVALALLIAICEFMALKRKREISNGE